tara:strand:- start:1596 stop:2798 length:1203 start_codon:yes stop_codon:yes gene_type:complete
MEIDKPFLILEINDERFIFLIIKYNSDLEYEVIFSKSILAGGVNEGRIIDIKTSAEILKKNLIEIEKKINFIIKDIVIINSQKNYSCINISGYKNLRGSQILKDDISYLINNIKNLIVNNASQKSLIHLFNSNYYLDNSKLDNLPIGLYGNFYNHHLTFFLLPKNDIKNLQIVLNKCNLSLDRIVLKNFTKGIIKIKENPKVDSFYIIYIGKTSSNVVLFEDSSLVYSEEFSFGSNIIMKDVSKVCKLELNLIEKIFDEINFDKLDSTNNEYLKESFFKHQPYRKISLSHLKDIVQARVDEMINLIYLNNINLRNTYKKGRKIYLKLVDQNVNKNLKVTFTKNFLNYKNEIIFCDSTQDEQLKPSLGAAELIGKGWHKEAIPIIHSKKSLISRIFSFIFE